MLYQARLRSELDGEVFEGFPDFLERVEGKSYPGDYHYEIWDTKLSKEVKPYFLVQLCCYAELLRSVQGSLPKIVGIVTGQMERQPFRIEDFVSSQKIMENF